MTWKSQLHLKLRWPDFGAGLMGLWELKVLTVCPRDIVKANKDISDQLALSDLVGLWHRGWQCHLHSSEWNQVNQVLSWQSNHVAAELHFHECLLYDPAAVSMWNLSAASVTSASWRVSSNTAEPDAWLSNKKLITGVTFNKSHHWMQHFFSSSAFMANLQCVQVLTKQMLKITC